MFDPLSHCHFSCEDNYGGDWAMAHPDVLLSVLSGSVFLTCSRISAGKTKSGNYFCQWLHQWRSTAAISNAVGHRHRCWQHRGQEELSSPADGPGVSNQHRQGMHLEEWGSPVVCLVGSQESGIRSQDRTYCGTRCG